MQLEKMIDCALGNKKAELVIKNAKIVDVFNGRIINGDAAICDGRIAGVGSYEGEREYDAGGAYLMPGFTDAHVHIESSMLTPSRYARAVLPKGTTSVVCDPHEIANVCGIDGIKFMMRDAQSAPMDFHFMLPSCVPAADFEDSGAVITAEMTGEYLKKYDFTGLAEMMNYPGLFAKDSEVLGKISKAEIVDGHAPLVSGKQLCAYAASGISTDHECTSAAEMDEKLAAGMYVLLRCGRLTKQFSEMASAVNRHNAARICLCTDDRNPQDIVAQGTTQFCIINAIDAGMDAFDAIRAATLNPAVCYGFGRTGAVAPGYKADLVLADDLRPGKILAVWKDGVLVAENGASVYPESTAADSSKVENTVNTAPFEAEDLVCAFSAGTPVISIDPGSLLTKKVFKKSADGLSHLAVIERHKATGKIGRCYLENYGITGGAIASCIGHDSHNITVAGDNAEDMALAVKSLGNGGGITVVKGRKLAAFLELPIAGLMSDKTADEVIAGHKRLELAAEDMGITPGIDPFMTLAFLSLPVIPELRLTARGIFDVTEFKFV